jgi:hypothetical protein
MTIQTIYRGVEGDSSKKFTAGSAFDTAQANDEYLDSVKATVIENVAALASTTVVAGRTYYLKEYHAGTGKGGRQLVGKAGSATYDDVITFDGDGGYFESINVEQLLTDHAGTVGDGVADDTAALQRALDSGRPVKGVRGDIYKTTDTLFLTSDNTTIDFDFAKIDNKADSMYAIVIVTDAIGAKTEANLITVLNTLNYGDEVENSHVKNLIVEMSAISGSGNNLGAGIAYGKNCTLENITVTQTNGNGVEIRNSTNCGLITATLTPRTYGMFNFMTKDCYAKNVNISGCDRGIITKHSQGGDPVNFRAHNCIVENLTNTLYYTVGGEYKERDLTDEIYEFGHEIVSDVTYDTCIFRSSSGTVKADLSFWATRFRYINCQFSSDTAVAGANIGLNGNQLAAKSGTVNTSGATVTYVSGDNFTGQTPGTSIVINSVTYTILTRNSTTSLTLTSSAGSQSGVAYSIAADVQGENHKFIANTFNNTSTVGAVCISAGAETLFQGNTFNGAYQRLLRAENDYSAYISFKGNFINAQLEASNSLDLALLSSETGATLNACDNDIVLTVKAGSGTLAPVIYNAANANDNNIKITGSSTYSAYPVVVSTGEVSNTEISVFGFADADGITITDAALVKNNELICDGAQTGTSRGIYASSGSVQVRDMDGNTWSAGWDSNQASALANNQQYPTYADEAAAVTGSLASGRKYKSSDGIMRVKL